MCFSASEIRRVCGNANACLQATPSFEEDDKDDEDLCIVCWEQLREVIFYHCMHMVRFSLLN